MTKNWFKREGIFYFPTSLIGWIVLLIAMGYSIYSFLEIDGKSHSVSDTLMNFVFRLLIIFVVYTLIGGLTGFFNRNISKND